MISVTKFVQEIPKPHSQYLSFKRFRKEKQLNDSIELSDYKSDIAPTLIGLVVDYLTRFEISQDATLSFRISLEGAKKVNQEEYSLPLLKKVIDLSDESIISATKLCGYDSALRAGMVAFVDVSSIHPSKNDIKTIRIMVHRALKFLEKVGPVVDFGTAFNPIHTHTSVVGDIDFLTYSAIWDFKVAKNNPTSKDILQILIYYLLAKRTEIPKFDDLKTLGFYNPRKDEYYYIHINEIPGNVLGVLNQQLDKYSF